MTPNTSSSRMMMYSSPSSLTSCPEYLPKRMRSPALTSGCWRVPSSLTLPMPAAITLPCCGFSLAVYPADLLFAFLEALDDEAVVEGSDMHGFGLLINRDCVDRTRTCQ